MEFRKLGRTDLQVSAFGLGCGNFGGIGSAPEFFGQGESEDEAFGLLDRAVELGINYLDTANAYGGGRSEATIGKWLAQKGPTVRESLLISSKVANPVGPDLDESGLSRRHILDQIDASLDRLGVDHLDMYIVHDRDPDTTLDETLDALDTAPTATKFESGTPPVPSIYAGVAGMDLMDEIGIAATEAHVQGLTDLLIEGLDEVDANIVTPLDPSKRGPMIAVASTDEHAMVQALADDGIVTSSRDGNVRLSWHCYNSTEDVDAVVAGMRRHAEFLAR